jgi:hypothetical protein
MQLGLLVIILAIATAVGIRRSLLAGLSIGPGGRLDSGCAQCWGS